MLDTILLLVGAAICVGLGIVIGRVSAPPREQPRRWSARPAAYGDAPDTESVRVGDTVTLEGRAGTVTATIGFVGAGAERWTAAYVDLGLDQVWVTLVDEERGLEVCRWTKLAWWDGTPGDGTIHHKEHSFAKRETGVAEYDAHGEVDLPSRGEVKFVDYADGEMRFSFENYDDTGWEASIGRVIRPGAFGPRRLP